MKNKSFHWALLFASVSFVLPVSGHVPDTTHVSPPQLSSSTGESPARFSYTYDASGRVTMRTIVLSSSASSRRSGKSEKPSLPSENESVPFSDRLGTWQVTVHPNPTQGMLLVEVAGESDATLQLAVYSLEGERLFAQQGTEKLTEIDLSVCPQGTYILCVSVDGQNRNYKIVKQ